MKVNITDFARRVGVTGPAVHHAIAKGRLKDSVSENDRGKKRIELEVGLREWTANAEADKKRNQGAGGRPRERASGRSGQAGLFPDAEEPAFTPAEFGGKTIAQWKAANMAIATKNAQLDLAEREGKLADVDSIAAEWFALCRRARDRLLIIADRIAGDVGAELGQAKERVHAMIDREIREALTELTTDGREA